MSALDSAQGNGFYRSYPFTDPGAGNELLIVVPGNVIWDLVSLFFKLTTSAVGQDRSVSLRINDGSDDYAQIPATLDQGISAVRTYTFARGLGAPLTSVIGRKVNVPLPFVQLDPGHQLNTEILGKQAGDTIQLVFLRVFERSSVTPSAGRETSTLVDPLEAALIGGG